MSDDGFCTICDILLVQRPHEPPGKFKRRKTCCPAHQHLQIALTRLGKPLSADGMPSMCAVEASLEPLCDWPVVPVFTDVSTMTFGRVPPPPSGQVSTVSSVAAFLDDADAGH